MALPFENYTDLLNNVGSWLDRVGDQTVTDAFPAWLALCEARIKRQQRWFVQFYSLVNNNVPLAITGQPMSLPTYVRDIESMWAATSTKKNPIDVVTPEQWRVFAGYNNDAVGFPKKATLVPEMDSWLVDPTANDPVAKTGSRLYLWPQPIPDGSFSIDFKYIRDLPALTPTSSHGLFVRHPDLYLYGTLVEAATFLQHDDRIELWDGRFEQAMEEINRERERAELSASLKEVALDVHFG
jgi:hypothetical protein